MKKVNLYGCTLAEKLIAFEGAINDLYSLLGDLGFYVTKEGYVNDTTTYNTQYITQPIEENSFIGRPIYFINSQMVAYVNTWNSANGDFTVSDAQTIRGPRGEQGEQGIPGINGTNGINGINGTDGRGITSVTDIKDTQDGDYTVTTVRIDYTEGDADQIAIRAKNGKPIPIISITAPITAEQGTLTAADMTIINENSLVAIEFNKEYYYIQDRLHSGDIITFVHTGYDGDTVYPIKAISVTKSTGGWVLTTKPSKYLHSFNFYKLITSDQGINVFISFISSSNKIPTSLQELVPIFPYSNAVICRTFSSAGRSSPYPNGSYVTYFWVNNNDITCYIYALSQGMQSVVGDFSNIQNYKVEEL